MIDGANVHRYEGLGKALQVRSVRGVTRVGINTAC